MINPKEDTVSSAENQSIQNYDLESITYQVDIPSAELTTQHNQSEDKNTPYNIELIEANGLELGTMNQYDSIEEVFYQLLNDYNINFSQVSMAFYDYTSDETFEYNGDIPMTAASIYKIPLVAMYIDAINNGYFDYDTWLHSVVHYASDSPDGSSGYAEGSVADLMASSIIYSDNASAWTLVFNLFDSWYSFANAQLNFANYPAMPDYFYVDNYMTASETLATLIKISTQEDYQYLIDLMLASEPHQLFTSYVPEGMANKYGRFENAVNDAGTYFENKQPVYSLTVFTDGVPNADSFIEELNLRVNEWVREHNF